LIALGFFVFIAVIFAFDVRKRMAANEKVNRGEEEKSKKRQEARERARAYEEVYVGVGKTLKDDLARRFRG
jgi:hypothetical protein